MWSKILFFSITVLIKAYTIMSYALLIYIYLYAYPFGLPSWLCSKQYTGNSSCKNSQFFF